MVSAICIKGEIRVDIYDDEDIHRYTAVAQTGELLSIIKDPSISHDIDHHGCCMGVLVYNGDCFKFTLLGH